MLFFCRQETGLKSDGEATEGVWLCRWRNLVSRQLLEYGMEGLGGSDRVDLGRKWESLAIHDPCRVRSRQVSMPPSI